MLIQWSEQLAVGHAEIDHQHRQLIDKFNKFILACHVDNRKEHLIELFNFLDRYVVMHFREEELIMERHHYPELTSHRKEHLNFIQRLTELRRELDKSGPTVSVLIHTNKTLLFWLTNHIKQIDVAFGRYLTSVSCA
jgi:hemerythrin